MINKNYWKELVIRKDGLPDIHCPTCNDGRLVRVKNGFLSLNDRESIKAMTEPNSTIMDEGFRFTLMMMCTSNKCRDIIACIGIGYHDHDVFYDETLGEPQHFYSLIYEPKYFIPPLNIIRNHPFYPLDLKKELTNSFSHFFSDISSCANKIRMCVEILMNNLKVQKVEVLKGKRKTLSLHERINKYKIKNPEVAEHLLAIKWIGNSGSHYGKLTKDDILDAYNLLDFSLTKIYNNQEKELKKLSNMINKRRAPLSRR